MFIPALAERMFPQKPREDPLLLDEARAAARRAGLAGRRPSAPSTRSCSCGWRSARPNRGLYVSFPTVEIGEGRPRVPSLYALEVWRAMTGRVPSADELQQAAARASQATLAWPAPADRDEAIDALEHDLATLRALVDEPDHRARGRAHYILQLNDCLQRSVRERFMRGKRTWSHWDGITAATDRLQPILDAQRLGARRYSLSALQKYAVCPYQFLLSAIYRMRPADDLEPLQRMDPLTRGSLFHAVQTAFYRRLQAEQRAAGHGRRTAIARSPCSTRRSQTIAARAVRAARAGDRSRLARRDRRHPARPAAVGRRDRARRRRMDAAAGSSGRSATRTAARSRSAAIRPAAPSRWSIDGRFQLHGSIDLVEEHAATERAARHRSQDRQVPRQGPHDRRRRRGAAAGAVLARARGRRPAGRSSRAACTTRRPPAATATCAFR